MAFKLNDIKIGHRLIVAFILVGVLPLAVGSWIAVQRSSEALEKDAFATLSAVSELKTSQIEEFVRDRMADVHAVPLTPFYVESAHALVEGSAEEKAAARKAVHEELRINKKLHGYYNEIKILDLQGNHLVSLAGIDHNEADKSWFKAAIANSKHTHKGEKCHDLYVSSIEHCAELNKPSIHMSHVIRHRETFEPIAMYVVDVDVHEMLKLVEDRTGLGETGETYIVGSNGLMQSNSRFESSPTILKKRISTDGTETLFGEKQEKRGKGYCKNLKYDGYHGQKVLAHNHYLKELEAGVFTEITEDEAFSAVHDLEMAILIVGLVGAAIVAFVGLMLANSICNPIIAMTTAMRRLAGGDLETHVPAKDRGDEVGTMAGAVQVFKDNAIEVKRLEAEQKEAELRAEAERKATMMKLADEFEANIKSVVGIVTSASTQLQSAAQSMSAIAEEVSRQTTVVSAATEEASSNVATVASATEELSASITEIANQVAQAANISRGAVDEAQRTNAMVAGLSEAAQKIGDVVSLINDIASQTNLLALNATIEAARAGDMGKGFAVVANEVKGLANQTAKATEEISGQITAVQQSTDHAVTAIRSIGTTIEEINEISAGIASAVEQQGAATQEIARNVQQAAAGTSEVASNVTGVSAAAGEAGSAAQQVLSAAVSLSENAEKMNNDVDSFIAYLRDQ